MADFEVDTRVTGGAGVYAADLSPAWNIWGPNGGYLCTIALRAVGRECAIARPVALYVHYLQVATFAPVEVVVEALARGKRAESFQVRITQDGAVVLAGMVRTAIEGEGLLHDVDPPPEVPAPEALPTPAALLTPGAPRPIPFWDNFDVRVIQPERLAFPRQPTPPRWLEWYRFEIGAGLSDPFVDAGRSMVLLDTLSWPSAWLAHPETKLVAPSLDFGAWFHRSGSASEWLLAESVSQVAEGGTIAARARVWDRAGRLLASSGTQLLCMAPRR